ncbi:MAG: DUF4199 domain-containing protein [Bacteroidia bacterium]|nr:DUF4199 domain-containing protein [Bacteroidia bacterium]
MQKKTTLLNNASIYGLITGIALVVFSMILNMLEMRNSPLGWLGMVIMAAGMWYGTTQWRDRSLGGYITFGKAWQAGTMISVFVGIIIAIFTYIYLTYVDPGSLDKELIKAEEKMMDDGQMTEEQIQMAMDMTRKFMSPVILAITAVISYVIFGMLISLITAAISKKENPNVFQESPIDQSSQS